MSIEIIFHPKNSSKSQLRKLLIELGFKPTKHLQNWPKGSLHFGWFNSEDYLSYDGVEATIHPPHEDEKAELGDCAWALHTRTRSSASPADRKQQNNVIRLARSKFGGNFYNDWFGRNRYIKVEDDYRDAPSRGIFLVYEYVTNNIRAVQFVLPEPNEILEQFIGTNLEPLSEIDPTRVLYNAMIPFVVAALEHFFSCCFKILLQYDPKAQERLKRQRRKIEMSDVLLVQSRKKTVEDVVVGWYSFQNINSIHNAFKEWFDIEFWNILRQKKKVGRRLKNLEIQLQQLIDIRHGVVHQFSVDQKLRKEGVQEMLDLALSVIDTFIDYLERKEGKLIRE